MSEATPEAVHSDTESVLEAKLVLPETEAAVDIANKALRKLKEEPEAALSHFEMAAVEAIIIPAHRPAFDVQDGNFIANHPDWTKLDSDVDIHARLLRAIPAVGRIDLPGQTRLPFGGTGFLIGPGLLMTNRHVAEIFARGLGARSLTFQTGWQAAIDFRHERNRSATDVLTVRGIKMIHPYWDMALLSVEGAAAERTPLKLSTADIDDLDGREIAVIGYPAYDPLRNDITVQNQLFDKTWGVKRLQPGTIGGRRQTESFKKLVSAGTHDCSTTGGASGSALIDLQTGEVLGLHFGGRYLDTNYAVPASELARDGRVVDAGVSFAGTPVGGNPPWSGYWDATEGVAGGESDVISARPASTPQPPASLAGATTLGDGSISITVPLHITVSLSAPLPVLAASAGHESVAIVEDLTEKLAEPFHDDDYAGRNGYDPDFLGSAVPMPRAQDSSVIALLNDGGTTLKYQNFALQMHAERRIALFTASNVTAEKKLKQPEPGKDYTRRGLSGLAEHDMEKWIPETRLEDKFQLPDIFFTKDQGAFDKGHIVRREDVAWGTSYDSLRRANGDTYHVTNCSPQIAQFNQSARGSDNWGDLENLVYANAASERLCVFAGPILAEGDETFVGTLGGGVKLRVKIPRAFWKVVVSSVRDGIAAYGFILEQDLSNVPLEMVVSDNFKRLMVPIAQIEARTGVRFPDEVRYADQFSDDRGQEVAFRAGLDRVESGDTPATPEAATPNSGDDEDADRKASRVAASTEGPINWRIAKALLKLRDQVNATAPNRKKGWDGTIGDAAHASRSSDHNPWIVDGGQGVVTALDITHDPQGGCDAGKLAESIRTNKDKRVKYVIWNRRIANASPIDGQPTWAWRPYSGANPHDHHVHISVAAKKAQYDATSPWVIEI
ncbi:MAG: DNA/RNA non-specific endonuclease [Pseudomonadota bacterium]